MICSVTVNSEGSGGGRAVFLMIPDAAIGNAEASIVDFLDEKGIELARRTVAKYREQLGILPSSKRKKLF